MDNKMQELLSDSAEAYRIPRFFLLLIGLWPKSNPTFLYKVKFYLIAPLFTTFVLIFFAIRFYLDIGDLVKIIEIIITGNSYVVQIAKVCLFYSKRHFFAQLLHDLQQPIFNSYPTKFDYYMKNAIRDGNLISKMYMASCCSALVCFGMFPFVNKGDKWELSMPFPFDVKNVYVFALSHFFQILSIIISCISSVSLDLLAVSMMKIAAAHLDILYQELILVTTETNQVVLENVEGENDYDTNKYGRLDDLVSKKIKACVKYHSSIISFVTTTNYIFSNGVLIQLLAGTIIICVTGLDLIVIDPMSGKFMTHLTYLSAIVIEMGLYCVYGNDVALKSVNIGEACYMSNWIICGPSVRNSLFIIMERSKRPLWLTAGKFMLLSLDSFASVIKTSYSYFAVLREVYDK